MADKSDVIVISGHRYKLDKVLAIGATGPAIDVLDADLNGDILEPYKAVLIAKFTFIDNGPVIFYKQNGKYTIILGKDTARKQVANPKFNGAINGHLISSVAIKKARIEEFAMA